MWIPSGICFRYGFHLASAAHVDSPLESASLMLENNKTKKKNEEFHCCTQKANKELSLARSLACSFSRFRRKSDSMAMVLKLGVVVGSASQWGEAQKLAIGSKSRGKQQQQQQPKSVFCGLRRQQQQRRLAVVRASGDNVEVQVKEVEEVETMEELADILPSGEWPENFSLLNFEDLSKHYEPILFKLEVCHGLQTTFWVLLLFSRGLGYSISLFKKLSFSHTNKKESKKESQSSLLRSLWSVICVLVSSFLVRDRCS